MDLRRERRKSGRIIGLVGTVVVLASAVLLALLVSYYSDSEKQSMIKNADKRASAAMQGITAIFDKENAEDEFSYEIKEKLSFESGDASAKLLLKNPSVNRYVMYLEIVVDDKVALKTGNIAPGQIIKEVKLDTELSKGEYAAVAYIYAVDPESFKTVGVVTQPITINIKK